MTGEELRQLGLEELSVKEKEWREQLFRLRFQVAGGQAEGVRRIRELKKDLARLLTVQREQELRSKNG
jgi:large subunit ribosomal protein L29